MRRQVPGTHLSWDMHNPGAPSSDAGRQANECGASDGQLETAQLETAVLGRREGRKLWLFPRSMGHAARRKHCTSPGTTSKRLDRVDARRLGTLCTQQAIAPSARIGSAHVLDLGLHCNRRASETTIALEAETAEAGRRRGSTHQRCRCSSLPARSEVYGTEHLFQKGGVGEGAHQSRLRSHLHATRHPTQGRRQPTQRCNRLLRLASATGILEERVLLQHFARGRLHSMQASRSLDHT